MTTLERLLDTDALTWIIVILALLISVLVWKILVFLSDIFPFAVKIFRMIRKGLAFLLSIWRMFTSPKKIWTERIAREMRLKRYRETDLETLHRKKGILLRQVADLWAPGKIPELQLADIKQVIQEKEAAEKKAKEIAAQKAEAESRKTAPPIGAIPMVNSDGKIEVTDVSFR